MLRAQMGRRRCGKPGHERRDCHHAICGIRRALDLDAAGGNEVAERIGHGRPS
jgi:hypothetical protein